MNRLTKKLDGSVVFPEGLVGVTLMPDNEEMFAILQRLAAYEDAGLTPDQASTAKVLVDAAFTEDEGKMERIRELTKADEDGRMVVLAEGLEQQSPCCGCNEGWETVTTAGTRTCHETCERLRKYEERLEAREAKEDACL